MMNKGLVFMAASALLISSCTSYTGAGAYGGSTFGAMLGSAIGGIAGGPRGEDIGTLLGMAGGAMVGAAVGAQADKKQQEEAAWYRSQRSEQSRRQHAEQRDAASASGNYYSQPSGTASVSANALTDSDSGFDPSGSGDDRLYDFQGTDYTTDYSAQEPTTTVPATSSVEQLASGMTFTPSIEIRNPRFVDDNHDGAINRGELCKVIFEVYNHSQQPLRDVQPMVVEVSGNKHIALSPGLHVEQIDPGRGIRYTALLKADNRLKDGEAKICCSVVQGGKTISQVSEFTLPTKK